MVVEISKQAKKNEFTHLFSIIMFNKNHHYGKLVPLKIYIYSNSLLFATCGSVN